MSVTVKGDTAVQAAETFNLALATPVGATISDTTGVATVANDD
ncbi:MAG TPA: hypothetical protein VHM89_14270 [Acidimicrobiales bacterium]|nr:hypothetical protein [Acidimicrobiales bacterium]